MTALCDVGIVSGIFCLRPRVDRARMNNDSCAYSFNSASVCIHELIWATCLSLVLHFGPCLSAEAEYA